MQDYVSLQVWSLILISCHIFCLFPSWQDSSTFSFYKCLPSGWIALLFSGVTTLISERIFLDRENFWPTFFIHFSIGFACFCASSIAMYVLLVLVHANHIMLVWNKNDLICQFSFSVIIVRDPLSEKSSAFVIIQTNELCPQLLVKTGWRFLTINFDGMHLIFAFEFIVCTNIFQRKDKQEGVLQISCWDSWL